MDSYLHYIHNHIDSANFAIMDIEAIGLGKHRSVPVAGPYSNIHNCTRKIAIIKRDETIRTFEFTPCLPYEQLTTKEKQNFWYCQRKVHHLSYYPRTGSQIKATCNEAADIVKNYLTINNIEVCLYKGGNLERELCLQMNFPSIDIGRIVPKASCHVPEEEVQFYLSEFYKSWFYLCSKL